MTFYFWIQTACGDHEIERQIGASRKQAERVLRNRLLGTGCKVKTTMRVEEPEK